MIIIIIAAAVAAAFLFGLIAYCCCCPPMIVPIDKKKKKKKKGEEEAPSPYTVHSYRGYVDSDDEDAFVIDTPTGEVVKRENHDIKKMKYMSSPGGSSVPYKVYGPRSYIEGLKDVTYMKQAEQMRSNTHRSDVRANLNSSPSEASIEDFATRSMQQSPGADTYSTVASSHHSTPSNISSFVEQAKEQYIQLQEASSRTSVGSSDTASKSSSFVDQAKTRLRHYKSRREESSISSSVSSSNAAASVVSTSSFVEQAKVKVQVYKQTRESLKVEHSVNESQSMSHAEGSSNSFHDQKDSSGDSISTDGALSYVEQAKANLLLYRQPVQVQVGSSTLSSSDDNHLSRMAYLKSDNMYNVSAISSDNSNYSSLAVVQSTYSNSVKISTGTVPTRQQLSGKVSNNVIPNIDTVVAKSRARYQALRMDTESKRLSSESNKSKGSSTGESRSSASDYLNSDSELFALSNSTVTIKSSTNSMSERSAGSVGIYQSQSRSTTATESSETRLEVSSSSDEALAYDSTSSSIDADMSRSDGSYLDRI